MAVGMTLLIPTFNAINNSYVQVDNPPPWIPSQLPENLQPPTHIPTPPPDWEPPEDWNPPPEWKDWKPPEDWPGKDQGQPPPGWDQGQCPPPVVKRPSDANGNAPLASSREWRFEAPEYTAAVVVNVTVTDWVADEIRGRVRAPSGMAGFGEERTQAGARSPNGLVGDGPAAVEATTWNWTWNPYERDNQPAKSGIYTVVVEADQPRRGSLDTSTGNPQISGRIQIETILVLPCGGAFQ